MATTFPDDPNAKTPSQSLKGGSPTYGFDKTFDTLKPGESMNVHQLSVANMSVDALREALKEKLLIEGNQRTEGNPEHIPFDLIVEGSFKQDNNGKTVHKIGTTTVRRARLIKFANGLIDVLKRGGCPLPLQYVSQTAINVLPMLLFPVWYDALEAVGDDAIASYVHQKVFHMFLGAPHKCIPENTFDGVVVLDQTHLKYMPDAMTAYQHGTSNELFRKVASDNGLFTFVKELYESLGMVRSKKTIPDVLEAIVGWVATYAPDKLESFLNRLLDSHLDMTQLAKSDDKSMLNKYLHAIQSKVAALPDGKYHQQTGKYYVAFETPTFKLMLFVPDQGLLAQLPGGLSHNPVTVFAKCDCKVVWIQMDKTKKPIANTLMLVTNDGNPKQRICDNFLKKEGGTVISTSLGNRAYQEFCAFKSDTDMNEDLKGKDLEIGCVTSATANLELMAYNPMNGSQVKTKSVRVPGGKGRKPTFEERPVKESIFVPPGSWFMSFPNKVLDAFRDGTVIKKGEPLYYFLPAWNPRSNKRGFAYASGSARNKTEAEEECATHYMARFGPHLQRLSEMVVNVDRAKETHAQRVKYAQSRAVEANSVKQYSNRAPKKSSPHKSSYQRSQQSSPRAPQGGHPNGMSLGGWQIQHKPKQQKHRKKKKNY